METLKVLIVDDEYLIRNLIRMSIDWKKHGFAIAGEAASALEALDLVEELQPDVIFTDICMPHMDGIAFSSRVLESHPDVKIVIVTGHDEFEYAQKSIKIGVSDFILKPIRGAELAGVADRLKRQIAGERARDEQLETLKKELERNLPVLREKFVARWLEGHIAGEELDEKWRYYNMPEAIRDGNVQVAVMEVMPAADRTEEQLLLLEMKCRNRTEAFFRSDERMMILSDAKNRIVMLAMNRDGHLPHDCERLKTVLAKTFDCEVNIGVGRKHERPDRVPESYREACRALRYKVLFGKNQVICHDDVMVDGEQPYHPNPDLLQQLKFFISVGSADRAAELLRHIFAVPFSDEYQVRLAAMDVLTQSMHAAIEQQIDGELVFRQDTLTAILTADNLPEIQRRMEAFVRFLAERIDDSLRGKKEDLISRVKAYLEENIGNPDLGLQSVAETFYVSPGHLGRLMKQETGMTFVAYLTNLRIRKAAALLRETDLRSYQIGEKVGIPDPHYFSHVFKKMTGMSVSEYREQIARKEWKKVDV